MERHPVPPAWWQAPLCALLLLPLVAQMGCGIIEGEIEDRIDDIDLTSPLVTQSSGQLLLGPGNPVIPGHDAYLLGDSDLNERYMAAFGFTSSLPNEPSETRFKRAVVRVFLSSFQGQPTPLGPILLDHLDGSTLGGFDGSVLGARALATGIPSGITDLNTMRPYDIDVTAQVAADRAAGRPLTLFLLSLQAVTDLDGVADHVILGGATSANAPVLILTFEADVTI